MKLTPIKETGDSKQGHLSTTYKDITNKIFLPNNNSVDDDKVKASWEFQDEKGRKAFIWCYKHYSAVETCLDWSVDGDKELLTELFGKKVDHNIYPLNPKYTPPEGSLSAKILESDVEEDVEISEMIELFISVQDLSLIKGDLTNVINGINGERYLNKEYTDLTFELSYSLKKKVTVVIPFAETISDILVPLSKVYKKIYKKPKKYGVFGHDFVDLVFEGLMINENGLSEVYINS